jgi:antitoxin component YwqK of YwqJK toxin-antitoxin module
MFKTLLTIAAVLLLISTAECKTTDTTVTYFKFGGAWPVRVNTRDSADFIRVIFQPDTGDTYHNIREYYRSGKLLLTGKCDFNTGNATDGHVILTGTCIRYFENGKKLSITNYNYGEKEGDEYFYFPDGSIYCRVKNHKSVYISEVLKRLECYNKKGEEICRDGEGTWEGYDNQFKNVILSGPIKKGLKVGEWHGILPEADSMKYIFKYDKGVFLSGVGYDKDGVGHPFVYLNEKANYRNGVLAFVEIFNNHLKLPKGPDGVRPSLDDVSISFVVQKDGHITDFQALGTTDAALNDALLAAFKQCNDWISGKYYGVPYKEQLILPLKFLHGYVQSSFNPRYSQYQETLYFQERFLGF